MRWPLAEAGIRCQAIFLTEAANFLTRELLIHDNIRTAVNGGAKKQLQSICFSGRRSEVLPRGLAIAFVQAIELDDGSIAGIS